MTSESSATDATGNASSGVAISCSPEPSSSAGIVDKRPHHLCVSACSSKVTYSLLPGGPPRKARAAGNPVCGFGMTTHSATYRTARVKSAKPFREAVQRSFVTVTARSGVAVTGTCVYRRTGSSFAASVMGVPSSSHRSNMPAAPTSSARRLASVFSTRVYRALAAEHPDGVSARLAPLATVDVPDTATLGERFEVAHRSLVASYRSEYVFKNTLVSKIVFGKHRPATASAIMEMPMGDSEADLLVLNGTSTVYEVKTDLDQFSRLSGQLRDYCTHADRVYVVTSDGRAAAAETLVPEHVGILALKRSGALSTVRAATSNLDQLRHEHLFRMLRRNEAQALLHDRIGYTPDVPTGHISERMGALFGELHIADAHQLVVTQLRQRGRAAASLTSAGDFPASLRALAYGAELSGVGRDRLLRRLHQPMALVLGA